MNLEKILLLYQANLQKEFNLIPILGCELEFYVTKPSEELMNIGFDLVKEDGRNQFEIRLHPVKDILQFLHSIEAAKKKILSIEGVKSEGAFAAKPFENQPGSALHMHLNFISCDSSFARSALEHSIAGLLHTLPDLMIFFAPYVDSYKRYATKSMTAPTNISWGPNNRTTSLRLIKDYKKTPRIEHRVAGSDANPLEVATAILFGSYIGIKEKLLPPKPTYGLAFDPQYNLPLFPNSLAEAKKNFTKSKFSSMFSEVP
jgi:glutamine synthetase